jgi:hypothetical protein
MRVCESPDTTESYAPSPYPLELHTVALSRDPASAHARLYFRGATLDSCNSVDMVSEI